MRTAKSSDFKKVLIVAFHFPPQNGSSGLLRTLKFCRFLPERGWLPIVLSVHQRAYERLDESQVTEIPAQVPVIRAFGLDTQRHFSFRGRYVRWLALPDRWVTWCLGAVPAGLRAMRKHRIELIFTTYPIVTAVLIGLILRRLTNKPWVVDFRDPITEDEYPPDPLTRRIHRWIERQAIQHGSRFLFTSPTTLKMYLERYPRLRPEACSLLFNGYDDEDFSGLRPSTPSGNNLRNRPMRLLHAGILYPEYRNPTCFFRALARLKSEGRLGANDLSVDLRAPGSESYYSQLIRKCGVEDLVALLPAVPYKQALQEGAEADGLLLVQGAPCNHQIPAKTFEYLRLRKPILALTPPVSDTAAVLRDVGGATIADLGDEEAIYQALIRFLASVRDRSHPLPDLEKIARYSRRSQAYELAILLSQELAKRETVE